MKKKLFSIFLIIFTMFIIFNLFYYPKEITNVIFFSIEIFIKNVFPSLFPMFIISNILIFIGIPEFFGKVFAKITSKLFKVKGIAAFVFFMSMLTGFPSNARYLKDLLEKKLINELDCNKILLFTSFANPLFVINTIGFMFFNNIKLGFFLFIAQLIGNIIVGFLFRNIYCEEKIIKEKVNLYSETRKVHKKINNGNLFKSFLSSINSTLITLLNIFGIITCFLIIGEIININFNLTSLFNSFINGLLEFTSGLKKVSLLDTHFNIKLYLSMFFISFGGLSVHAQIINILNNYKIKYYVFLLARIIHGLISILILYLLINL